MTLRVCCRFVCLLLLLVMFGHGLPLAAQTSVFDADTSTLSIPCIAVSDAAATTYYSARLGLQQQTFSLLAIEEIERTPRCTASFSFLSNELIDTVRAGDDEYRLLLRLRDNNQFAVIRAENAGPGPTSVWRLSDGVNHLFLGGTIHILRPSDFPLPATYDAVYRRSDLIVTELLLPDNAERIATQPLLLDPLGRSLQDRLSPGVYQDLLAYLAEQNESISAIDTMRAVWAHQFLLNLDVMNAGYQDGVDIFFQLLARADSKPNRAFETMEFQTRLINQLYPDLTDDQLIAGTLSAIKSGANIAELDQLVAAWRFGDMAYFGDAVETDYRTNEQEYNLLVKDRNLDWIPQIEQYLTTPEIEFILVGVGHFPGRDGLIPLLEDAGYFVQRYLE